VVQAFQPALPDVLARKPAPQLAAVHGSVVARLIAAASVTLELTATADAPTTRFNFTPTRPLPGDRAGL
jgi:hypothetical protein